MFILDWQWHTIIKTELRLIYNLRSGLRGRGCAEKNKEREREKMKRRPDTNRVKLHSAHWSLIIRMTCGLLFFSQSKLTGSKRQQCL